MGIGCTDSVVVFVCSARHERADRGGDRAGHFCRDPGRRLRSVDRGGRQNGQRGQQLCAAGDPVLHSVRPSDGDGAGWRGG